MVGGGLQAFMDAEQAWARMADRNALDAYLRSLDSERLRDVISSLDVYEEHFSPEHVIPGSIVLLNLLPNLRVNATVPLLVAIRELPNNALQSDRLQRWRASGNR